MPTPAQLLERIDHQLQQHEHDLRLLAQRAERHPHRAPPDRCGTGLPHGAQAKRGDHQRGGEGRAVRAEHRAVVDRHRQQRDQHERPFQDRSDPDRIGRRRRKSDEAEQAHEKQRVGELEPERASDHPRGDVGNVCHRVVAFGTGERHENRGLLKPVADRATEVAVHRHDLPVANAFVPGGGEPFPGLFEEMELGMQRTLDEDTLCDHRPRRRGAARREHRSGCAGSARSRPARAVAERRRRWPLRTQAKAHKYDCWTQFRYASRNGKGRSPRPRLSDDAVAAVREGRPEPASGLTSTRCIWAAPLARPFHAAPLLVGHA